MRNKIIDYLTVSERQIVKLDSAVKELIVCGWQPLGTPVIEIGEIYNISYQTMVKYAE